MYLRESLSHKYFCQVIQQENTDLSCSTFKTHFKDPQFSFTTLYGKVILGKAVSKQQAVARLTSHLHKYGQQAQIDLNSLLLIALLTWASCSN
jgi:hypothetical protein